MLQNLSKGKMVEWLVLIIALVTLGLSIAALAKPCSSNFGDTCQSGGYGDCPKSIIGKSCDPVNNKDGCEGENMRYGCEDCGFNPRCLCKEDDESKSKLSKKTLGGNGNAKQKPSLKPFRFYYDGSNCVSTTKTIAGETYPTMFDCEKAMGLIVGPGGQDSHPEHSGSKSSNLPLILGITCGVGSVLVLLALAFILIRK